MRATKTELLDAYAALREAGVDVSCGMAADKLDLRSGRKPRTCCSPRATGPAEGGPQWFQRLRAGDVEATAEYERLNRDLAG